MKKIIFRQIIFIPLLYIGAKLLWNFIPIDKLPAIIKSVVNDFFGPPLLMIVVLLAFIYLFWKIPILGKISQCLFGTRPNIQGTWQGQLKYEWEGKKAGKTVFLSIKQLDGYSMHIWLFTNERNSSSIFSDIISYRGLQRIIYTYSNEESPENKEKNPSHEGYCYLDIVDPSNILQGIYYTDRKTFGELNFDKRNCKVANSYKSAQILFGG